MTDIEFAHGLTKVAQPQNSDRWCTSEDQMTIVFVDQEEFWPIKAYRWISVSLVEVSTDNLNAAGALFEKHRLNLTVRRTYDTLRLGNKRQEEVAHLTEDGQAVYNALLHRYKAPG